MELVQRTSQGGSHESGPLARARRGNAFQLASQRFVELDYELLSHRNSIGGIY
jgi:hypothetical protein